jgi:flagellar motor protein MotB
LGGHPASPKDESEVRWLISYSDFMMQLVCLFILLYSVSSLDKEKMSLVAAYYRASIGRGEAPVHEPASKGKNLAVGDRPLVSATGGRADIPPSVRYTIEQVPGGWIARFQEAAFAPGSSTLSPEVASDLDTIAARLRSYAGSVFVTATAAAGPADASDGDALRLAAARAEAATSRLTREGSLDARFVQATGKATPAEEARRLEILVRVK